MSNNRNDRLAAMLKQVGATDEAQKRRIVERAAQPGVELLSAGGIIEGAVDTREQSEADIIAEALDIVSSGDLVRLRPAHRVMLESIVMPDHRPVVDIVNDGFVRAQFSGEWERWKTAPADEGEREKQSRILSALEKASRSVGRVDAPGVPYAGTGFVVGKDLIMTNRHVASIFAEGVGTKELRFQSGMRADFDFGRQIGIAPDPETILRVEQVAMIHPFWDMALLRVDEIPGDRDPLALSNIEPSSFINRDVMVMGYPGFDPRDDPEFQEAQDRIFRGKYSVKRAQPGKLRTAEGVESYDRVVNALTHDCSTLGGNSGSAVLLVPEDPNEAPTVVGLHFAGLYLVANFAVPAYELAQDERVRETDIVVADPKPEFDGQYVKHWAEIETTASKSGSAKPGGSTQFPMHMNGGEATWTIPLNVSVSIGAPPPVEHRNAETSAGRGDEGIFTKPTYPPPNYGAFSLDRIGETSFSWDAAHTLALASKVAYLEEFAVKRMAKERWGFLKCKFVTERATQCFIAATDSNILISFRGTTDIDDWIGNIDIVSVKRDYGHVHRGFFDGLRDVEAELRSYIDRWGNLPVTMTGHSLGGALATIAAAEWFGQVNIRAIYTYGQPASVKGRSPEFFLDNYGGRLHRIVNDDDIIPQIPPTYRHVGKLYHLDKNGDVRPRREYFVHTAVSDNMLSKAEFYDLKIEHLERKKNQLRANEEKPQQEGIFPSVNDHSMYAYIAKAAKLANIR